jgi:type IV secretory pathway TrbF-like protein
VSQTVADLSTKTPENARRQFVELYGSALTHNTYLRIALLFVSLLACGLLVLNFRAQAQATRLKPLVIRIDAVGRAEAVQYDAATYRPQPQELRFFLTQFVLKHFSRLRSTLQRDYTDSLYFLDSTLAEATISQNEYTRALETFVRTPSADEIDVDVTNVALSEIAAPPYKASVDFQRVFYAPGTHQERKRESYIAQIDFALRDEVPAAFIRVNPLGLQISHFRIDQAFEEAHP